MTFRRFTLHYILAYGRRAHSTCGSQNRATDLVNPYLLICFFIGTTRFPLNTKSASSFFVWSLFHRNGYHRILYSHTTSRLINKNVCMFVCMYHASRESPVTMISFEMQSVKKNDAPFHFRCIQVILLFTI